MTLEAFLNRIKNAKNSMEVRSLEKIKNQLLEYKELLFLALCGVFIGVVVGAIDAGFGRVLLAITSFRDSNIVWLLPWLAPAGVVIVWVYQKFGGTSSKGMGLVFETGHGTEEEIPLRLIPFVIGGTWLTHLFGGSAGREGVAVQIGATFSHWFGRKIGGKERAKVFLVAGMAAGFAGLFGTPLAAVLFALEVLVCGALQYEALIMAVVSAFTASMTAGALGLEKFERHLEVSVQLNGKLLLILACLGIIFGLVGALFAVSLKIMKQKLGEGLKNPIIRILLCGILLSILLLLLNRGRYAGLGTNLIHASFEGETLYSYDWILKLLLTVFTLSAGFQGGEVTPLFSIGASLGVVVAPFFGIPSLLGAALGYAAVFGSATNTFLAPMFIGAEVFGYEYLPCFFVVCTFAYLVNGNHTIYSLQRSILKKSE